MSALPGRAWRGIERFADGPLAGAALVGAALLVYGLVSYALPLAAGRDLARYLLVYAQLFDADVVYPHAVLTRTPVAPLVAGGLLDLGPLAAEVGAAALYAVSILAWCSVARRFGAAATVATAAALLLYPGYVLLFHELASDAVFAAAFALFAVACTRALEAPSAGRAAVLGASVALLVLVRPVAQVLLLLVLVPLLAARTWPGRIRSTTAFVLAAGVPLLAWTVHNGVRLDDYTVVRGGGASVPLFRAFVADRIVDPDNGPASRELARVVARDLLPHEPYRSYGIDLDRFFSSGSSRMHDDLVVLADRTWGWDDDYRHLGRVGREAVRAHPGTYVRGVARDTYRLVLWPLYPPGDPRRRRLRSPPGAPAALDDDRERPPQVTTCHLGPPVFQPEHRSRLESPEASALGDKLSQVVRSPVGGRRGQLPPRVRASRSRRRAPPRTSRRPTAGSAKSGRPRPSTTSSSPIPPTPRGLPRSTGAWTSCSPGSRTGVPVPVSCAGSRARRAGTRGRCSGSSSVSSRSPGGGRAAPRSPSCSRAPHSSSSCRRRSPSTRWRSTPSPSCRRSSSSPPSACSDATVPSVVALKLLRPV